MDGDPVNGEPSEEADIPKTYTEVFMRYCPQYLAMGMTWDEYWHNNTKVHKAYREAFEIRRRDRNNDMYMMGGYIFETMVRVSPLFRSMGGGNANVSYMEEPYPLTKKEARERQEARDRENYRQYIAKRREASERELKRRKEAAKGGNGDG